MNALNDDNHPASEPDTGLPHSPEPSLDRKRRFAQRVGVSPRCVDNWLHHRRIPFLRVGKVVLIPWKEAIDHLNRNYRITPRGSE